MRIIKHVYVTGMLKLVFVLTTTLMLVWQVLSAKLEDKKFWYLKGKDQIKKNRKLFVVKEYGAATNVIIFIGDGMGPSTVTATRMYKNSANEKGEGLPLSFEEFPYVGQMRTYNVDHQVTDGAASATAMFTGNCCLPMSVAASDLKCRRLHIFTLDGNDRNNMQLFYNLPEKNYVNYTITKNV